MNYIFFEDIVHLIHIVQPQKLIFMYKSIVNSIKSLKWQNLSAENLQSLMVLAAFAATEFGGSLRIALRHHPKSSAFLEMAEGELQTNNLRFGTYTKTGDHADFLWYFIEKNKLIEKVPLDIPLFGAKYFSSINGLPEDLRVMSVVSREHELSEIFRRILEAEDWSLPGLPEFKYYLEEHRKIDSKEGGHSDLLKDFAVDDSVAEFYKIRLGMYECLTNLF